MNAMHKPMKNDHDKALRKQLADLLKGGGAHAKFEDVAADFPVKFRGQKPSGMPHSPWMLLEHLRIAQKDILEFCRNPKYAAPVWPDDYWPKSVAPPSDAAWTKSVAEFDKDLKVMLALIANPKTDLFARIPWSDGQTILREALLVADHNAYHVAQLVDVRRMLGAWRG
jgi:hypothetical protein